MKYKKNDRFSVHSYEYRRLFEMRFLMVNGMLLTLAYIRAHMCSIPTISRLYSRQNHELVAQSVSYWYHPNSLTCSKIYPALLWICIFDLYSSDAVNWPIKTIMSGIVGIFASIGEHIPILKKEKFGEPHPEGEISRFHYRGTSMLILACCLLVTSTEWISGELWGSFTSYRGTILF